MTLFRDETVGALDAPNGKEYLRMLKRAVDLGGLYQAIFISATRLWFANRQTAFCRLARGRYSWSVNIHVPDKGGEVLVGAPGFEPGTSCAQGKRATRLRHAPIRCTL